MMDRRSFLASGVTLLAAPRAVGAQAGKVPRVGVLLPANTPVTSGFIRSFTEGLRDLGYVQGRNITIEVRDAQSRADQLPRLATELVRLQVDVIVTGGEGPIRAAMQATHTIPIVIAVTGDAVGDGFVASLAHPGSNVTGLSLGSADVAAKRLQLLKEAFPRTSRVAVLWNVSNPGKRRNFDETGRAAQLLGLTLYSAEVRSAKDFDAAFASVTHHQADGLVVLADEITVPSARRIAEFAAVQRLPAIYEVSPFVEAGGLMFYGPSVREMFRRAATYVDKILKGAKPADLPVEQPTKFALVINMKTAKALGLTIPPSFLLRADEVIQ